MFPRHGEEGGDTRITYASYANINDGMAAAAVTGALTTMNCCQACWTK